MTKSERPGLSACLIAKDDAKHIRRTIESVVPVADEVVVVLDDRSSDGTVEILQGFGERVTVIRRAWNHSFSDARNVSIDAAAGPWILALDADEDLDPASVDLILDALNRTPENGGPDLYTCPLLVDPTYGSPAYAHPDFGPCGIVFRDRIFWKPSGAQYRFRVHESLLFPGSGYDQYLNARFFHRGTMAPTKADYYTALLVLDNLDHPGEPVPATMLAEAAIGAGDTTRAARILDVVDEGLVQGLNGAKYWIAKGKCCQRAWLQASRSRTTDRADADLARGEALACYLKAADMNKSDADGPIMAATLLFMGFDERGQDAAKILRNVVRRDSECVIAKRMIEIYERYGGPDGDLDVFRAELGNYLTNMANVETEAHLRAEGLSEDPAIANVERLDEILSAGGRQADGPAKTKGRRRLEYQGQRSEGAVDLKMGG